VLKPLLIALATLSSVNLPAREPQRVTLAMAQITCLDGDRSGNFARIENAMVEAREKGAQIVVFPESCLLGWENPEAHKRACPIPGEDSDRLAGLAKKYRMFLCVGLDEKDGANLYDSAILIDDSGAILLKHRKINVLPELMTPPYSVGKGVQTVQTKYGRIGVMICADSFVDDLVQSMAGQAPDLVLIPYGWAAPEAEWPKHGKSLEKVVRKVAAAAGCPVVGTDLVGSITNGPWRGQVYGGLSVAVDSSGQVMALGRDRDRDVVVFSAVLGK